ncbi:RrF2 family transcriptional regulator [Patescibacteria group bacterium]
MKLTRKSEYGLRGILYLAKQSERRAILTSEVSNRQNIPQSFLNKIFQKLVRAGVLRSYRGYRGGFSLAKKPSEITLRSIIETLEGPIDFWPDVENSESELSGTGQSVALTSAWDKIQRKINRMLDRVTVMDLLKKSDRLNKKERD